MASSIALRAADALGVLIGAGVLVDGEPHERCREEAEEDHHEYHHEDHRAALTPLRAFSIQH